jgi:hypothetical protein
MENFKGGFPPIKYCSEKIESDNKKVDTKIRTFSSGVNKNINIRQILKENISKPLINILEDKNDYLEIIDII